MAVIERDDLSETSGGSDAGKALSIERLVDRRSAALSYGRRQRVDLGRAPWQQPPIFLPDEPLLKRDAKLHGFDVADGRSVLAAI